MLEWTTCLECGWLGLIENDVSTCPWCGYDATQPLTEEEKNEVVTFYMSQGFICSKQFITRYSKWKK
mgnify:CR=1 FL=1